MLSYLSPQRILTVSELTELIRSVLDMNFDFVRVEGEVSNLTVPSSGHHYFTLKDEKSQLRAVLFRGQRREVPFEIQNGQKLVCLGRLSIYPARGEYQLIVEYVEPAGLGSLHLAYEQLKEKLDKEGLFADEHKKPLPPFPKRIGVVTSPTGAAVRDILHVLERRNLTVDVLIAPASVQGEGSAGEIAAAIDLLDSTGKVDVIIAGRGGGSLEDLWAFNEEVVARAIYRSSVPVISAVGHERDFTISDFVADLRAPTPSAAAEIVSKSSDEMQRDIDNLEARLCRAARSLIAGKRSKLDHAARLLKHPGKRIYESRLKIDELVSRLELRIRSKIKALRTELKAAAGRLDSLSPLAVLARGYSITVLSATGEIIRDKDQVERGDEVDIKLHRGKLICRVEKKR